MLALVLPFAGCGKKAPPLVPAGGTVQAKGKPVAHVTLQFTPDPVKNRDGHTAMAQTGEDGSFRLQTPPYGEGAVVGTYRVTVTGYPGQKVPFSSIYTRLDKTTLVVEIPQGGKSDLVLKLE
jgi:hypothetical protein